MQTEEKNNETAEVKANGEAVNKSVFISIKHVIDHANVCFYIYNIADSAKNVSWLWLSPLQG